MCLRKNLVYADIREAIICSFDSRCYFFYLDEDSPEICLLMRYHVNNLSVWLRRSPCLPIYFPCFQRYFHHSKLALSEVGILSSHHLAMLKVSRQASHVLFCFREARRSLLRNRKFVLFDITLITNLQ